MEINDLTDEQRAKLEECETPEQMLALAKSEGFVLSDAQLERISGGEWSGDEAPAPQPEMKCPYCGSTSIAEHRYYYECQNCYKMWNSLDEFK